MAGMHPLPIVKQFVVILLAFVLEIILFALMGVNGFFYLILLGFITILIVAMIAFAATFTSVKLSPEGITCAKGILNRDTTFIPYEEISDVKYTQMFPERIFGVGTLFINTAGSPTVEVIVHSMRKSDITIIMKEIKGRVKK